MERVTVRFRMAAFPYTVAKLSVYLLKEQCSVSKRTGILLNILFSN